MTTTFHQSKRLWELGVRKNTERMWGTWKEQPLSETTDLVYSTEDETGFYDEVFNAYNAEELIQMGVKNIEINIYDKGSILVNQHDNNYQMFYGPTLAQTLAEKLIHDIEKGIITLEEINK